MEIEQAILEVETKFPFPGYMKTEWDYYRAIAQTVLKYLPKKSKILDFGSGPCEKTAIIQTLGFDCSAYDDLKDEWHTIHNNQQKILEFAQATQVDFHLAPDHEAAFPFAENSFDMVMMHGVIEHLHSSPKDLINNLLKLVKEDGYLFITVPNAVNIRKRLAVLRGKTNLPPFDMFYWSNGPWRGHIREYTKDDLQKLATFLNLEIIELRSCHTMLAHKMNKPLAFIFKLITNLFPGWRDSWLLVAKKNKHWSAKAELSTDEYQKIWKLPPGTL